MATTSSSALSAVEQAKLIEESKRAAAHQAVQEHMDAGYRHIGIGSGSTVIYVVEAIAAMGPELTKKMSFYPTGDQSRELIKGAGFPLRYIQDLPEGVQLDVVFDGADEVDDDLNLIKGGGACLFQEKLVATRGKKFVCVADFRKFSTRLGTNWKKGIPIEVVTQATGHVLAELKKLGSLNPKLRSGLPAKAGAVVTDNGNSLIDAPFPPLALAKDLTGQDGSNGVWTVDGLADKLIKIVGVVETGLFTGHNSQVMSGGQKPCAAYFGMADGSVEVRKAS
ncbi:ribose 5-phosphate isomerase [Cryphonectria parasitica EP155]|uniref:Ribose-5-phosphate isomerase n=1 Tax=Cryphonectria parasitica (strain ATCC 38755 / EP155) TaxID=660469 RepID=A0A9P4Y6V4_CRYP1|nr:ribose 5-phosphate isomerase [Cryphonectria parasitica EP155]KAF3767534.1 ribose 5-phosphate isomerase [Cryphonectria parasitica EP155]